MILPVDFYHRPTLHVARDLIGKVVVYRSEAGTTAGAIRRTCLPMWPRG